MPYLMPIQSEGRIGRDVEGRGHLDVTDANRPNRRKAGACAVMALERVPSDIRKEGGVARMAIISKVKEIMKTVSIPVMAKCRIGHFAEARVLEALEVDFIDESEVLTPADEEFHIWKRDYKVPFVCGCRNLGEALRRIAEGAAMIRTKGEAGSGNIVEAVRHMRTVVREMKQVQVLGQEELVAEAKKLQAPLELVEYVHQHGKLPVPNFSAGGIATPADASLCRLLGAEAVRGIRAFSELGSRRRAPRRSSRPARTTTTRRPCSKPAKSWATRCRVWTSGRSRRANCYRHEAGNPVRIGVLALQGDFEAHAAAFKRACAGCKVTEVRMDRDLDGLDGLVIPGGESTAAEADGSNPSVRSVEGIRAEEAGVRHVRRFDSDGDGSAESAAAVAGVVGHGGGA